MDISILAQPAFWIKAIILILIGSYIIFSFVILSQVNTMTQILHLPHTNRLFRTISKLLALFAISLFLFAIVIL